MDVSIAGCEPGYWRFDLMGGRKTSDQVLGLGTVVLIIVTHHMTYMIPCHQ